MPTWTRTLESTSTGPCTASTTASRSSARASSSGSRTARAQLDRTLSRCTSSSLCLPFLVLAHRLCPDTSPLPDAPFKQRRTPRRSCKLWSQQSRRRLVLCSTSGRAQGRRRPRCALHSVRPFLLKPILTSRANIELNVVFQRHRGHRAGQGLERPGFYEVDDGRGCRPLVSSPRSPWTRVPPRPAKLKLTPTSLSRRFPLGWSSTSSHFPSRPVRSSTRRVRPSLGNRCVDVLSSRSSSLRL